MLTENEKKILGIMVDMGHLRGEERTSAGTSDDIARELIAAFKERMGEQLPQKLEQLGGQKAQVEMQIAQVQGTLAILQLS